MSAPILVLSEAAVAACADYVHAALGPGLSPAAYREALSAELCCGPPQPVSTCEVGVLFPVTFRGQQLSAAYMEADLVVDGYLAVKVTSSRSVGQQQPAVAQCWALLRHSGAAAAILINFGEEGAELLTFHRGAASGLPQHPGDRELADPGARGGRLGAGAAAAGSMAIAAESAGAAHARGGDGHGNGNGSGSGRRGPDEAAFFAARCAMHAQWHAPDMTQPPTDDAARRKQEETLQVATRVVEGIRTHSANEVAVCAGPSTGSPNRVLT